MRNIKATVDAIFASMNKPTLFQTKKNKSSKMNVFHRLSNWWYSTVLLPKSEVYQYIEFILLKSEQSEEYQSILKSLEKHKYKHFPNKDEAIKRFYTQVRKTYQGSDNPSLVEALEPYLNSTENMVLSTNENTTAALRLILKNSKKTNGARTQLIKASVIPMIYLLAIVFIVNATDSKIVRLLENMAISNNKTPTGMLKLLISVHDFVLTAQWFAPFVIIAIAVVYRHLCINLVGTLRTTVEKIWLFGLPFTLNRDNNASMFLNTLSILFQTGFTTQKALEVIKYDATPYLKYQVTGMEWRFSVKGKLTESLHCPLFKDNVSYLLSIYMDTKNATEHIDEVAERIDEAVTKRITSIAKTINMVGMIMTAAYILIFTLANMSAQQYLS
ncbi:type II secretion system F family protein [Vibrio anguillarum]|uniref:Type II secretion system protein GspF domain-containing protein n=2 Tax=Vibrio anguillarum TaxID=55601 RepID=A0ABR9Z7C9_VIBAN|nr:type II secretion system F family protein [Vibrio anguillarum]MBF4374357.1 hypothetical protein [Vibrio anguillarum]